jgi:hypothetical protein
VNLGKELGGQVPNTCWYWRAGGCELEKPLPVPQWVKPLVYCELAHLLSHSRTFCPGAALVCMSEHVGVCTREEWEGGPYQPRLHSYSV